eukprot:CAMPEP_0194703286 /NCGR_PEP_ID=MMETSP0295-20121207/27485_1 /TAXON_ID=39354 /ORGANISM="Heterosigma akashiwo, Strain CCMP2393" /LENGTH=105 /DNA_ID=CAMNT_0039598227 /DNA_START=319 /DNA_END=633 /DNA_ORIENTATION=-
MIKDTAAGLPVQPSFCCGARSSPAAAAHPHPQPLCCNKSPSAHEPGTPPGQGGGGRGPPQCGGPGVVVLLNHQARAAAPQATSSAWAKWPSPVAGTPKNTARSSN